MEKVFTDCDLYLISGNWLGRNRPDSRFRGNDGDRGRGNDGDRERGNSGEKARVAARSPALRARRAVHLYALAVGFGDVYPALAVQFYGYGRPEQFFDVGRFFVRVVGVVQLDLGF